jgi:hypothetical protein
MLERHKAERNRFLQIRLTTSEKNLLRELARRERLTYSGLVRTWLRLAAEQYGILKPMLRVNGRKQQ